MNGEKGRTLPRVCVVTAPAFAALGDGIALHLQDQGFLVRVGQPDADDDAIVVVLSNEVPPGLDNLLDLPARLIPIKAGEVDAAKVPDELSSLNWVPWDFKRAGTALESVAEACRTELPAFFEAQSLEARALGWEISGKLHEDLITTWKEQRQLTSALKHSVELTPTALEFIEKSRASTRRASWIRWFWRGVAAALLVTVALVYWQMVTMRTKYEETRTLYLVASSPDDDTLPIVQIPKFAGLVLLSEESGEAVPLEVESRLTHLLSNPGPVHVYGDAPNDMYINSSAISQAGDQLLISGDGTLWRGSLGSIVVEKVATVPHAGYYVAANANLEAWAVSDGRLLTVSVSDQMVTVTSDLETEISSLSMQHDGTLLVAVGHEDAEVYALAEDGQAHRVRTAGDVLAVGEAAGELSLLQGVDGQLQIVGARSGRVLRSITGPPEIDEATLMDDGRVALVADNRLWAEVDGAMVSSGFSVPTNALHLLGVSDHYVLLTTVGEGTMLVDLNRGIALASICEGAVVRDIDISSNGQWAACRNSGATWVWDLLSFLPAGPASPQIGSTYAESGGTTVSIVNGALEVTHNNVATLHDPSSTRPAPEGPELEQAVMVQGSLTTVSLSPDGTTLAYGTDVGEVVVADLSPSMELLGTQAWLEPYASAVTHLTLTPSELVVSTRSASWVLQPCTGCRNDRSTLLEVRQNRRLPCYPGSFEGTLPARVITELGLKVCNGGE